MSIDGVSNSETRRLILWLVDHPSAHGTVLGYQVSSTIPRHERSAADKFSSCDDTDYVVLTPPASCHHVSTHNAFRRVHIYTVPILLDIKCLYYVRRSVNAKSLLRFLVEPRNGNSMICKTEPVGVSSGIRISLLTTLRSAPTQRIQHLQV